MIIEPGIFHEVPEDLQAVLEENQQLLERWNKLTPIQRNEWICWIITVKKAETRADHLRRFAEELREGQRSPCCWPGCPHRRESSQKWFKGLKE